MSTNDINKLLAMPADEFLTEIYKRYGRKLYSYSIRTWKISEDDTWDLIYKTLYKVKETYTKYEFEKEEKFASFIFRIFINNLRNHYQVAKRTSAAFPVSDVNSADLDHIEGNNEKKAEENPKLKALKEALDEMEDWQRVLLLMRSEGQSYNVIAKHVDKPENQLKVYYQRLKEQLSKKLNERK